MNSTAAVLQTLKGQKLHVLIAIFSMAVLPVSETEIAAVVGCNRKTTRSHLMALEKLGLVTRNSRFEAWTLTAKAYQLPLPLRQLTEPGSGTQPAFSSGTQPANSLPAQSSRSASQSSRSANEAQAELPLASVHKDARGKSYPSSRDVVVVDHSIHSGKEKQQQTPGGKSYPSPTAEFLHHIGMSSPAPALFADRPLATAVAWWWYLRMQDGLYNPHGVLFRRLQHGHEPPAGLLALAGAWPELDQAERDELRIAATGRDAGQLIDTPAKDAYELRRRRADISLDDPALAAYLQLLAAAPEELYPDE